MAQLLLILAVALVVGAVVFGVAVLISGGGGGLDPAEPDGCAVPLPTDRPLAENDMARVRFDTGLRGYRMAQVDQAMRRAAYDIGYKDELIGVLEAEVQALRAGRAEDAEVLRRAREAALTGAASANVDASIDSVIELDPEPLMERAAAAGPSEWATPGPAASGPHIGAIPTVGAVPREPAAVPEPDDRSEAEEAAREELAARDGQAADDQAVDEQAADDQAVDEQAADDQAADDQAALDDSATPDDETTAVAQEAAEESARADGDGTVSRGDPVGRDDAADRGAEVERSGRS